MVKLVVGALVVGTISSLLAVYLSNNVAAVRRVVQ